MTNSESGDYKIESIFAMGLGVTVSEVSAGFAVLEMEVTEETLNAFKTVHGGALFTLADTAFGIACNLHGSPAVGLQANMNFLKPAYLGDTLTATATEENLTRSTGVYNVRIDNQKGETVALFRGIMYRKAREKKTEF